MKKILFVCCLFMATSLSAQTIDKLQGVWEMDGLTLVIEGDTADADPYGVYFIQVDEAALVIHWTPVDANGVAHRNVITSITNDELILDADGDSGQHEVWRRKK